MIIHKTLRMVRCARIKLRGIKWAKSFVQEQPASQSIVIIYHPPAEQNEQKIHSSSMTSLGINMNKDWYSFSNRHLNPCDTKSVQFHFLIVPTNRLQSCDLFFWSCGIVVSCNNITRGFELWVELSSLSPRQFCHFGCSNKTEIKVILICNHS